MKLKSKIAFSSLLLGALALSACATDNPGTDNGEAKTIKSPVAISYDSGVYILNGETLEIASDIKLDGFSRVNPAGDDQYIFVTNDGKFKLVDASSGKLSDISYGNKTPGHVVSHHGKTILFDDGTAEVTVLETEKLAEAQPNAEVFTAGEAHHGVAVALEDGTLVVTKADRSGVIAYDSSRKEIANSGEVCPGIHGETVGNDEVVVFGCEDGALLYEGGHFHKLQGPASYGRIGNLFSVENSDYVLGDYRAQPEDKVMTSISLINTATEKLDVVPLPSGVSYTFRSLARGPHGEVFVLGHDGKLYQIADPANPVIADAWQVVSAWSEPENWQEARPSVFVRGHDVYVTDPAKKKVYRLDSHSGEILAEITLSGTPNEITGVKASDSHSHGSDDNNHGDDHDHDHDHDGDHDHEDGHDHEDHDHEEDENHNH